MERLKGLFEEADFTRKKIRDRYERLHKDYDTKDRKERAMSKLGGKVGELDELLAHMKDERDELRRVQQEERVKLKEQENRSVERVMRWSKERWRGKITRLRRELSMCGMMTIFQQVRGSEGL